MSHVHFPVPLLVEERLVVSLEALGVGLQPVLQPHREYANSRKSASTTARAPARTHACICPEEVHAAAFASEKDSGEVLHRAGRKTDEGRTRGKQAAKLAKTIARNDGNNMQQQQ